MMFLWRIVSFLICFIAAAFAIFTVLNFIEGVHSLHANTDVLQNYTNSMNELDGLLGTLQVLAFGQRLDTPQISFGSLGDGLPTFLTEVLVIQLITGLLAGLILFGFGGIISLLATIAENSNKAIVQEYNQQQSHHEQEYARFQPPAQRYVKPSQRANFQNPQPTSIRQAPPSRKNGGYD